MYNAENDQTSFKKFAVFTRKGFSHFWPFFSIMHKRVTETYTAQEMRFSIRENFIFGAVTLQIFWFESKMPQKQIENKKLKSPQKQFTKELPAAFENKLLLMMFYW